MGLYRVILTLAAPILILAALWRVLRRQETITDLRQRLGWDSPIKPGTIWLHGASNGELTSARPLAEALVHAFPMHSLVITSNSVTGRDLAATWRLANTTARLAPLDLRRGLRRFRGPNGPAVLLLLENELWPNRIDTAREPVLIAGARMSRASHRTWSRFPGLAKQLMARIDRLWPQDDASAERFRSLGVPKARIGPTANLKSAVALADPDKDELNALGQVFPRAETFLAASTHEGEETTLIEGFLAARQGRPDLRLILAPRHPARGAELAAMIDRTGLTWARRSTGHAPGPETLIYLADTLGEMPFWYALAGVTFVGGSLVEKGGHTPFEPARAGSAILAGPYTANFTDAYRALTDAGGAMTVRTAQDIKTALETLQEKRARSAQAERAALALAALDNGQAVIDDVVHTLQPILGSDPGQ